MLRTEETVANPRLPITGESDSIELTTGDETLVVSEAGNYSSCDVWFKLPAAWAGQVVIRVYAWLGTARVLLRRVSLSTVPLTVDTDGSLSGVAISVRGHPCLAFEVTCQKVVAGGPDLSGGLFFLQVWHSDGAPLVSGGDLIPEIPTSAPMVAAVLVGRDPTTGGLVQVSTDSTGRFLMSNPLFTTADRALLDGVTDAATPSTLAKRDASGDSHFRHLYINGIDHEPSSGNLLLGTQSSTTQVTIGSSSATTTLWNATLEGTTTVVDSTSLQVSDRVVTVNRTIGPNAPVPSQITGISVMRGDISGAKRDFVGLFWDESGGAFRLANNTSGDDSTLGPGLPLVATEFRGPAGAPAVIRSNSSGDAVQLKAGSVTLLSVLDSSGTTKLDAGDRPVLVGASSTATGAGHAYAIQAQQGAAGSIGGNLSLQAGKGGTPGTNAAGDIIFENGQTVGGATGLNRWQANGSDYLTMQQTSNGPTFQTPDGCQLIMKSSGNGTSLNSNNGNLNLSSNSLATLIGATLTLGGSTFSWEDAGKNNTVVLSNVRTAWSWTFDAGVTLPTFTQADTPTSSATGAAMLFQAQNATGTATTGGAITTRGGGGSAKGGPAALRGGDGTANGAGGDAIVAGGIRAGTGQHGGVLLQANATTMLTAGSTGVALENATQVRGAISPPAITGPVPNWAPANGSNATVFRVACSAAAALGGLSVSQIAGEMKLLINISAFTLTLNHLDAGSAAANRFTLKGNTARALVTGEACWIWYDGTSALWRVIG